MIWVLMFILNIIFFKVGIWFALFAITLVALKACLAVILALSSLLSWRWFRCRRYGRLS